MQWRWILWWLMQWTEETSDMKNNILLGIGYVGFGTHKNTNSLLPCTFSYIYIDA